MTEKNSNLQTDAMGNPFRLSAHARAENDEVRTNLFSQISIVLGALFWRQRHTLPQVWVGNFIKLETRRGTVEVKLRSDCDAAREHPGVYGQITAIPLTLIGIALSVLGADEGGAGRGRS